MASLELPWIMDKSLVIHDFEKKKKAMWKKVLYLYREHRL